MQWPDSYNNTMPPTPPLTNAQLYARSAGIFTLVYAVGCYLMVSGIGYVEGLNHDYGVYINTFLMWILGCPYAWVAYIPLLMIEQPYATGSEEWRVGFAFGLNLLVAGGLIFLLWLFARGGGDPELAQLWLTASVPPSIVAGIAAFSYAVLKTNPPRSSHEQ